MKAHLRNLSLAPKKANLVAAMVRRHTVVTALAMLKKIPKKAAHHLYQVIQSAAANAENNDGQNRKDLYIKELIVNKGAAMRRSIPMARGRARPIDKFMSHITVKLGINMPKGVKEEKGAQEAKVVKETRKKKAPLKAEVGAPVAHAPGNPAKQSAITSGPDDSSHAAGGQDNQAGATFIPHRQGSRGE